MGETLTRRWLLVLVALVAVVALAACSSSDSDGPQGAPSAPPPQASSDSSTSAAASPSATSSASPSRDTSIADALAQAGISDALAEQLIAVANAAGYGPADKGFAVVMVDTCRDVSTGYSSWDEVIDQDVADGAPRAKAEDLYRFLRVTFCPHVKAAKSSPQPTGNADATSDDTRGLGSSADYLDAHWKHGDPGVCRAAVGAPFGEPRAYVVRQGVLACGGVGVGVYGDTFINLDVVFTPAASETDALKVAQQLLPKDATFVERRTGTNPPYANRDGSCPSLLYRSAILRDAVNEAADDGVDPAGPEVTATLYTDRQTNYGSSAMYDGTVHVLSLSIGGFNLGYKAKNPTC